MSFKKTIMAVAAVGALTAATAVPAMALENEFHGMYKFMGYQSNVYTGVTGAILENDARSGFYAEQRARLMYTAKANDNLKLVTHFELDSRFGGVYGGYKGTTGNDSGNLDADQLTLETKSIYLDFNCPLTGTNFKVGMQPWADSYGSLFVLADMTGVYATKKFDPLTVSLGWFRFADTTTNTSALLNSGFPRERTADLIVADAKFALTKDMILGASYYNVQNDTTAIAAVAGSATANVTPAVTRVPAYDLLHVVGVNADLKFGPATVRPFAAYEFGEQSGTADISAYLLGATAKVQAGPGAVNLAAIYLSGDKNGTGDNKDFKPISAGTTYFNPANMWLLVRSGQAVNSSFSVVGNDLGLGGRGSIGLFAGYEGTANKVFYNANIGHLRAAESRGSEAKTVGTEINAQVGYKMYDNMSVSAAAAYAFLGDASNADDPYLVNVQVSYVF